MLVDSFGLDSSVLKVTVARESSYVAPKISVIWGGAVGECRVDQFSNVIQAITVKVSSANINWRDLYS